MGDADELLRKAISERDSGARATSVAALFERVIDRFPNTAAAETAKALLFNLQQKVPPQATPMPQAATEAATQADSTFESTKRCQYCGEEILAVAIKCKHCGSDLTRSLQTSNGPAPKVAKTRGPFKVLGYGLLALAAWSFISIMFEGSNHHAIEVASNSGASSETRPDYTTTAEELFKAYNTNEVATDQMIGNARVVVSGRVASIDKDFLDNAVIELATGEPYSHVGVTLSDSQKSQAAGLQKGYQITVRCNRMQRIAVARVVRTEFFL